MKITKITLEVAGKEWIVTWGVYAHPGAYDSTAGECRGTSRDQRGFTAYWENPDPDMEDLSLRSNDAAGIVTLLSQKHEAFAKKPAADAWKNRVLYAVAQLRPPGPDGLTFPPASLALRLSEAGFRVELRAALEDTPVRGNVVATGNPSLDHQAERAVLARLANGDVWAWCSVVVSVRHEATDTYDVVGSECLGGCSYDDAEDFKKPGGYYEDMVRCALSEWKMRAEKLLRDMEERGVDLGGNEKWMKVRDLIEMAERLLEEPQDEN